MAILASVAGLAAPVTGALAAPISATSWRLITATLPLDWTNLVVESLNGLFTAS